MKSTGAAGAGSPKKKAMKKTEEQHPSISVLGYMKYMTKAKKATEDEKKAASKKRQQMKLRAKALLDSGLTEVQPLSTLKMRLS